MSTNYFEEVKTFTEESLPDLDQVVLASLQFLSSATIPRLNVSQFTRPLVIGSVNALSTGKILFDSVDAVFADEGNYMNVFNKSSGIDAVYVISASGGKHSIKIAEEMGSYDIPVFLITSNPEAPARKYISESSIFVFPHIREPYTYNTSTYMGMLLGASTESPAEILAFIEEKVAPKIPQALETYQSFVITVLPQFGTHRSMFETKFDELFGPVRTGRSFTSEEIKHAKIVVPSSSECFLNFGTPNTPYAKDEQQFFIPIPESCGPLAMLAIGYFVIGVIQKQNEPYFKDNIQQYVTKASQIFGENMSVIVE